jgi:hypothetical protein
MLRSRVMWGVAFLAAASMGFAQNTPQSAPAPKAPAKTEQPGTAAGGQSSGAVVGAEAGTFSGVSLTTVAVVAGAVAAVAVVANNTKSTTSH